MNKRIPCASEAYALPTEPRVLWREGCWRARGYKKSHTRNNKDTSRILDDRPSTPSALQLPGASGRASDDVSWTKSTFCERSSRAAPGIEPGTFRTLSENHTTRPSSQKSITPAAFSRATSPAQHLVHCNSYSKTKTTARGFKPLRAEPNGLRVHLLNQRV